MSALAVRRSNNGFEKEEEQRNEFYQLLPDPLCTESLLVMAEF